LTKTGRRTLKQKLVKFILKIWDKEQLPTRWSDGIICQAYKKGSRMLTTIDQLHIAYNILAVLLDKKLSDIVKKKLEECHMSFGPNRYTIDNIFIIRHFLNVLCHNIDLHNIFVDYTVFWLCI
jgi:hypothetical protein